MVKRLQIRAIIVLSLVFFGGFSTMIGFDLKILSTAYADGDDGDDNDNDGDDDDDDDDRRSPNRNNDRSPARNTAGKPVRQTAPVAVARMTHATAEIVALGLSDDDIEALATRGYRVIEREEILAVGGVSVRLEVPSGTTLAAAQTEVQSLRPDAVVDLNHFYRTDQGTSACSGPHCMQFNLIKVTPDHTKRTACSLATIIGMIDTGINPDHEAFANSRLEIISNGPEGLDPSSRQHGTAVAALLIGDPDGRTPGLLPSARLLAIDAFHKENGDERSDVFSLIQAMDELADDDVQVINMSLSGPPNDLLKRMVGAISERGIVIVAAAGNGGPNAAPVFPGAYEQVIAVTAVDRNMQVYRRAARGPHIDFSAPGVELWTAASVHGARNKTGTSFAAPFVSAAIAVMLSHNPDMALADIIQELANNAHDLGDEGFDEIYGHGLIQITGLCNPPPPK